MGATKLRYASEGPFVENEDGGFAKPGVGFQTRSVFVSSNTSLSPISTSLNTVPITSTVAELENVQLSMRYRAALELHLMKTDAWTATGTVAFGFQYSADEGTTWTTWFTQTITYGGQAAHTADDQADVYIQTIPVLGTALTGVAEEDTLQVRVLKVLASGVDEEIDYRGNPSYVLQFIEEL